MSQNDFEWNTAKQDGDVVVPSQSAIAVYANSDGDIVIRREAYHLVEDEDVFIVIPRKAGANIARAINRTMRESAGS